MEAEKVELALRLNCRRRQLSRKQNPNAPASLHTIQYQT